MIRNCTNIRHCKAVSLWSFEGIHCLEVLRGGYQKLLVALRKWQLRFKNNMKITYSLVFCALPNWNVSMASTAEYYAQLKVITGQKLKGIFQSQIWSLPKWAHTFILLITTKNNIPYKRTNHECGLLFFFFFPYLYCIYDTHSDQPPLIWNPGRKWETPQAFSC